MVRSIDPKAPGGTVGCFGLIHEERGIDTQSAVMGMGLSPCL